MLRYLAILSACIWNFYQHFSHLRLYGQQQHMQNISDRMKAKIKLNYSHLKLGIQRHSTSGKFAAQNPDL